MIDALGLTCLGSIFYNLCSGMVWIWSPCPSFEGEILQTSLRASSELLHVLTIGVPCDVVLPR